MKSVNEWFFTRVLLPLANKNDLETLQSFAVTMAIAFPIIFMLLLPWVFSASVPIWPIFLSAGLTSLYFFAPRLLYYPYIVWMIIASILGYINTRIILAIAYYLLIVPIGLFMQWRNGLEYKHHIKTNSVWIIRTQLPEKKNLKEPF